VRLRILEAVVQVIPWDDVNGQLAPWSGSGTIISPDGYLVTNFHVVGDLDTRDYFEYHSIWMTDPNFTDQAPQMSFWAQVIDIDPTHDLALLKIVQYPDESPIPADLRFTSVTVGDSNDLFPGDAITIVGYPAISGGTITFTAGLMSGWLGEDFETGGKQWIKTDAKISHGNSGGAAFNSLGQLIGVPTAGRTVQYEELDVEEQAYVRPIGLAWAMIGPNVANVSRADGAQATTSPVDPPPSATTGTPSSGNVGPGQPSGDIGPLVIGELASGTIAPLNPDQGYTYHGYVVEVPPGVGTLYVAVYGGGADLDLAVKVGAPIENYDDVDHLDTTELPDPTYSIVAPPAGPVYIDVLNLLESAANYEILVTADNSGGQANPLGDGGQANPLGGGGQTAGPLQAPSTEPGTVGELALGQQGFGDLTGLDGAASYHTYIVNVPAGVSTLTIRMDASDDLDMAVKFGSEIFTYEDGGDFDFINNELDNFAEFVISNPQPGFWYVDVFNALGPSVTPSYTLNVTAQ
jgi:serine protease Do